MIKIIWNFDSDSNTIEEIYRFIVSEYKIRRIEKSSVSKMSRIKSESKWLDKRVGQSKYIGSSYRNMKFVVSKDRIYRKSVVSVLYRIDQTCNYNSRNSSVCSIGKWNSSYRKVGYIEIMIHRGRFGFSSIGHFMIL